MRFFDWVWWRFAWGGSGNAGDECMDERGLWVCLAGSLWWLDERVEYRWDVGAPDAPSTSADDRETYEGCPHPHCDSEVLHAPSVCVYCDGYPKRQQRRRRDGVNFTGESDPMKRPCPSTKRRPLETINRWSGNRPNGG